MLPLSFHLSYGPSLGRDSLEKHTKQGFYE